MGGLTSTSDVRDLLVINPLVALHQNAHVIHSELSNGHLVLDGIFKLLLLRILKKRELGVCLSSLFPSILMRRNLKKPSTTREPLHQSEWNSGPKSTRP